MPTFFGFLLITVLIECTSSCEEKLAIKEVFLEDHERYWRYDRNTNGNILISTKNVTLSSTITCSNIISIKDIVFTYEEHEYEQFLKIVNSNISALEPLEFSEFSTITKLYLNENHVRKILPGTFNGLTRLKELYLSDNELTEVKSGVYNSLHRLELLNLTNNKIQQIDTYSFMGVVNLRQLYLKQNDLTKIEDGLFETLQQLNDLDLSRNPLLKFPFQNLSNIETLILSETLLSNFEHDLSNLTMKVLNLANCQLTKVDFSYFPKLDSVELSHNKIEVVENCGSLDTVKVKLDNNKILTIEESFGGISRFSTSHNKIKNLKNMFSDPKSLLSLDFSFNQISTIDKLFFQNMSSLTELIFNDNNLSIVDPVLFHDLTNLKVLDLSSNQIEEFQYGTFDTLTNLLTLNISNNKLLHLHQYTLISLQNLSYLHFDNNRISSFDVEDLNIRHPYLLEISLNHNPWICKNLVKTEQLLKKYQIEISPGYSYDVDNFRGIACSNPKEVVVSSNTSTISIDGLAEIFQKAIENGVKNSKLGRFFDDYFEKSKFLQYFDKDYSRSNFFKFFDSYKVAVTRQGNLNDTKMEKLTGLQAPSESNTQVLVIGVVLLSIILLLLLLIVYLMITSSKKPNSNDSKFEESSQMELC